MLKFMLKRLFVAIPTLLILITVSFALMRLAPGGPFTSEKTPPPAVLANLEAKYNLDKPLVVQYGIYMRDLILYQDFGPSFKYQDRSVTEIIKGSFPRSAIIGLWSFFFIVVIGIPIGIWAALRQNQWQDYSVMSFAMSGVVFPNFVLAPLCVWLFAVKLGWLPGGGWGEGQFNYLILPIVAMATSYIAQVARLSRGSMIEVLSSSYIRTAKAKGLPTHIVLWRHAMKPALMPVITYLGIAFVGLITGSVIVDQVFQTGGIGQHFVQGAINRDYSLILGVTILAGALSILFNAIVDMLYTALDPRIRY